MKVHLMFPAEDFDPQANLPPNMTDLMQDMELDILFSAMAEDDEFLDKIIRPAVLSGGANSRQTILWRQDILRDCLENEKEIRALYAIAVMPVQIKKSIFLISGSRHPSLMLSESRRMLEAFYGVLKALYDFSIQEKSKFSSAGMSNLCEMIISQLSPDYLDEMKAHLAALHFDKGLLFSAKLGTGNTGKDFIARFWTPKRWAWLKEWRGESSEHYRFMLDPHDESGARELADLRDDVLKDIAVSATQASTHIEKFFYNLRAELAFYIGCLNLRKSLVEKKCPLCMPEIADSHDVLCFDDLRDPTLSLTLDRPAVGNRLQSVETKLIFVMGANQGGKSTFLRSLGLSRMMLQAGMFVTAMQYKADLRDGVFTHYRRHEDKDLNSGKFDEELHRMSVIIDQLGKAPFLLFNESFAATNEKEGAEVAGQILSALVQYGAQIIFVTHMYALTERFEEQSDIKIAFLQAERDESGHRSFKISEGKPQDTSFGRDLYANIFGEPKA